MSAKQLIAYQWQNNRVVEATFSCTDDEGQVFVRRLTFDATGMNAFETIATQIATRLPSTTVAPKPAPLIQVGP